MSAIQKEHASAIERLAPSFADLRLELCNYMSDGQFWMIYFILLLPRLNEQDFKLLSTPKARFLFFMFFIGIIHLPFIIYTICFVYEKLFIQSALGDVEQIP